MTDWLLTFFALFFTDILYTHYIKSVNERSALKASVLIVLVFLIAGVAVIQYTTNHWLLIPACLGKFCGTYVSLKQRK
jgi:hypothetical protein